MAVGLALAGWAWAAGDFTRTMTPEEKTAAGLDKLSEAELAQLKAVVERYKSGEVTEAKKEAEARAAAAEAKVAETPASGGKKQPGWLGALLTLKKAEEKPDEAEEIETRLAGKLVNFEGRRRFELENGQVWQMIEAGSYAGPALVNPRVTVRPGLMGAFWLKIPEAALRAKVKPLKLE